MSRISLHPDIFPQYSQNPHSTMQAEPKEGRAKSVEHAHGYREPIGANEITDLTSQAVTERRS